jgi:hypothetical protein
VVNSGVTRITGRSGPSRDSAHHIGHAPPSRRTQSQRTTTAQRRDETPSRAKCQNLPGYGGSDGPGCGASKSPRGPGAEPVRSVSWNQGRRAGLPPFGQRWQPACAVEQAVAQGRRVGGRRPFGYSTAMHPLKREAAAVRWAYAELLAGASLGSIARDWNAHRTQRLHGERYPR